MRGIDTSPVNLGVIFGTSAPNMAFFGPKFHLIQPLDIWKVMLGTIFGIFCCTTILVYPLDVLEELSASVIVIYLPKKSKILAKNVSFFEILPIFSVRKLKIVYSLRKMTLIYNFGSYE